MREIFSLLLVALVFASVLGQVMASPFDHHVPPRASQPAQQANSTLDPNHLEGCNLLNRTDPIRDYYGNVTECHEIDGHHHFRLG